MEYCGKDLITSIEELKKSQDLSFKTLLQWFITTAKGIQCMHDNGYVHLDIKPPNITIYNNEAKLIDFGLAHNISDIQEQLYMGTLDFMAPEMANSIEGIDYKICDIYSLGMTFAHSIAISLTKKRLSEEENTEEDEDEEDLEDKYDDKEKLLSCIELESMLSEEPMNRPTIREVVKKLTSISMDTVFEKMFNLYGYSIIADLHDAGFNPVDLHDGGFNLLDIFKSGYNYGEIRDIYKKNKHSNLATLLSHCDKKREGFKRHITKDCTINTICSSNPHLTECKQPVNVNRSSRKSMGSKKSRVKSSRAGVNV
jgi:serine/threonine protein kinase